MLGALPSAIEALAGRAALLPDSALCRALSGALFGAVTVPYLLAALEELPGEVAREFRRFLRIAGRSHAGTG